MAPASIKCRYALAKRADRVHDPRIPTPLGLTGYCYYDEISASSVRLKPHRECPFCLATDLIQSPVDVNNLPDPKNYETGQTLGASELDNLKRRRDIPMASRQRAIKSTYTRKEKYPDHRVQHNLVLNAEFQDWNLQERADMDTYGTADETWNWRPNMTEIDNIKRRQDLPVSYRKKLIIHSYFVQELRETNEGKTTWTEAQKVKDVEDWIEIQCKDMEANWVPLVSPVGLTHSPGMADADEQMREVLDTDPIDPELP
jgi:hypothetical protein